MLIFNIFFPKSMWMLQMMQKWLIYDGIAKILHYCERTFLIPPVFTFDFNFLSSIS